MHLVEVGHEAHRLPDGACGGGIDPGANLNAIDDEIDHRLHTHRLHDIESCFEWHGSGYRLAARLGNVLGAQPERQLTPDPRTIPRLACRGTGKDSQSASRTVSPAPFATRRQGKKFIVGEPINPATK